MSIDQITSFKTYVIGPLIFLFFQIYLKAKKSSVLKESTNNLLIVTTLPIIISTLIAVEFWYAYFIPIFLILILLKLCDDFMPGSSRRLNYLLIYGVLFIFPAGIFLTFELIPLQIISHDKFHIAIYFLLSVFVIKSTRVTKASNNLWKLLVLIFVLNLFFKLNISNTKPFPQRIDKNTISYYTMKPIFESVILETNWNAKFALKRIYFISKTYFDETSLFFYYSLAKESLKEKNINLLQKHTKKIDGYFVFQHFKQFMNYDKDKWKHYLSHSSLILNFIKEEIKSNKLIIQTPKLYDKFWLVPYQVTKKSSFPKGFNNIGQPYYWEEPYWLKNCKFTNQFINEDKFYYCIVLSGHLQKAGVYIKLHKNQSMNVSFFGPLLGTKAEYSNLDGFDFWSNTRILLFCNNKRHTYIIPDIGYKIREESDDIISEIQSLNSPLTIRIPVHCKKKKISQIRLNFNRSLYQKEEIIWDLKKY